VTGGSRGRHYTRSHPKRTVCSATQTTTREVERRLQPSIRGRSDGTRGCHAILLEANQDRWTGEGYHLGTNKEVFDAELYAIYRAVMRFGKRREHDQEYTIFVDSQVAIKRCFPGHQGPGKELAMAIIRWSESVARRGGQAAAAVDPRSRGNRGQRGC